MSPFSQLHEQVDRNRGRLRDGPAGELLANSAYDATQTDPVDEYHSLSVFRMWEILKGGFADVTVFKVDNAGPTLANSCETFSGLTRTSAKTFQVRRRKSSYR